MEEISGSPPELSTGGGTSDGRFISPAGIDVVELGLSNATVHKVDEQVKIEDVIALCGMYKRTMELLLNAPDVVPNANAAKCDHSNEYPGRHRKAE